MLRLGPMGVERAAETRDGAKANGDPSPGTATARPSQGRRLFIKAALGVAPVILTVRSRPAWAQGGQYPSMAYGANQDLAGTTEEPLATAPTE
jgi:hypothetical protein